MNLDTFLSEREPAWEALAHELKRARGRPERLGTEGALALGRGYRAVIADLAYARRRFPGDPIVDRLERLALAGRHAVYGRRSRGGSLLHFVTTGYWRLIAARLGALATAALATFVPCLLAAIWGMDDPGAAIGLVPGEFKAAAHPHLHKLPGGGGATALAAFASSIFTHNIEVSFLAFAGGLLLGAGSIAILAYNGLTLGALAGITIQGGNFAVFVRYVAPHGMLELSCFTVAGAAGLRLVWAMIDAGRLSRGESLRREARPAVAMILGTAPWLVVAGLTEGFVTPHALPLPAAVAVGVALACIFWTLVVTRGFYQRARSFALT
jgi:uncharacterized membrane protein SpoIIM required for sporulation